MANTLNLDFAKKLHSNGRLLEADKIYKKLLKKKPNDTSILYLYGTLCAQLERYDAAVKYLKKLLSKDPQHTEAYNSLGLALQGLGDFFSARECFCKALKCNDTYADALRNLVNLLYENGDIDSVPALFSKYEHLIRSHPLLSASVAQVFETKNEHILASDLYANSLRLDPHNNKVLERCLVLLPKIEANATILDNIIQNPVFHLVEIDFIINTAKTFLTQSNIQLAVTLLNYVLQSDPNNLSALEQFYNILKEHKKYDDALNVLEKLITVGGKLDNVLTNCLLEKIALLSFLDRVSDAINAATALVEAGNRKDGLLQRALLYYTHKEYNKAARDFEKVLIEEHNNVHALVALSGIYLIVKTPEDWLEKAQETLEKALQYEPNNAVVLSNLAFSHRFTGKTSEALSLFKKSIALDPNNAETRYNCSLVLLAVGNLDKGWEEYEWRWKTPAQKPRHFANTVWTGEMITGKSLLIYSEQGLGDELLFASCITDVEKTGADCFIECDARLVELYARSFPWAAIVPKAAIRIKSDLEKDNSYDYQIAIGSLPRIFRKSISDFEKQQLAYLIPDQEKVKKWENRLTRIEGLVYVGFSWKSGMTQGVARINVSDTNYWQVLLKIENTVFINLQYGDTAQDIEEFFKLTGKKIVSFEDVDLKNDIDELLALVNALDLVVSIPNAVAALAGATGVPVLRVMSPKVADPYRHGLENYPWFPSMIILSQYRFYEDFEETIEEIIDVFRYDKRYFIFSEAAQKATEFGKEENYTGIENIEARNDFCNYYLGIVTGRGLREYREPDVKRILNALDVGDDLEIIRTNLAVKNIVRGVYEETSFKLFCDIVVKLCNKKLLRRTNFQDVHVIAQELRSNRQYQKCIALYELLIVLFPKKSKYRECLAAIYFDRRMYKKAWKAMEWTIAWKTDIEKYPKNTNELMGKNVLIKTVFPFSHTFPLYHMGLKELSNVALSLTIETDKYSGQILKNNIQKISFIEKLEKYQAEYYDYIIRIDYLPFIVDCFNSGNGRINEMEINKTNKNQAAHTKVMFLLSDDYDKDLIVSFLKMHIEQYFFKNKKYIFAGEIQSYSMLIAQAKERGCLIEVRENIKNSKELLSSIEDCDLVYSTFNTWLYIVAWTGIPTRLLLTDEYMLNYPSYRSWLMMGNSRSPWFKDLKIIRVQDDLINASRSF